MLKKDKIISIKKIFSIKFSKKKITKYENFTMLAFIRNQPKLCLKKAEWHLGQISQFTKGFFIHSKKEIFFLNKLSTKL